LVRFLTSLIDRYNGAIARRPFLTHSITAATLFIAADCTSQAMEYYLERHTNPHHVFEFHWQRLFAVGLFAAIVMGPIGHLWYTWLDRGVHAMGLSYAARPTRFMLVKLGLDLFLFAPLVLICFFATVSALEGASARFIGAKLERDVFPAFIVDLIFWPAIQWTNFRYVPVSHQLLIVNMFLFLEDIFLSYVQHRGVPPLFARIDQLWIRMRGKERIQQVEKLMQEEEKERLSRKQKEQLARASSTSSHS
jgi:protein Mpv17